MTDYTYETKESRRVDAAYSEAYDSVANGLRSGRMSVTQELEQYPELDDAFNRLMSEHYRRELTPEQLAHQLSTLLCDLVAECAEWAAERKING